MALSSADSYAAVIKLEINSALRDAKTFMTYLDPAEESFHKMGLEIEKMANLSKTVSGNMSPKGLNAMVKKARQLRDQIRSVAHETGKMQGHWKGSTLAAQNAIRIVQDAPYGIIGITNNVQQMAESWGQAKRQGVSFGKFAKGLAQDLLAGPFAVPLIISTVTAFALSWDKVKGAVDRLKVALGLVDQHVIDIKEHLKELQEAGPEDIVSEYTTLGLNRAKDRVEQQFNMTKALLSSAQGKLNEQFSKYVNVPFIGGILGAYEIEANKLLGNTYFTDIQEKVDELTEKKDELENRLTAITNEINKRKVDRYEKTQLERAGVGPTKEELENQKKEHERKLKEAEKQLKEAKQKQRELLDILYEQKQRRIKITKDGFAEQIALEKAKWDHQIAVAKFEGERYNGEIADLIQLRNQSVAAMTRDHNLKMVASDSLRLSNSIKIHKSGFAEELALEKLKWETKIRQARIKGEEYNGQIADLETIRDQAIADMQAQHRKDELNATLRQYSEQERALRQHLDRKRRQQEQALAWEKHLAEVRRNLVQGTVRNLLTNTSGMLQTLANNWQTHREQELERMGYTEQEKYNILQREGKKRFQLMKAGMIAEAVANAYISASGALRSIWSPENPVVNPIARIAMSVGVVAGVLAKGFALVSRLKSIQPGGNAPSGNAGGGFDLSPSKGFTALNVNANKNRRRNYTSERNRDIAARVSDRSATARAINRQTDVLAGAMGESSVLVIGDKQAERLGIIGDKRHKKTVS